MSCPIHQRDQMSVEGVKSNADWESAGPDQIAYRQLVDRKLILVVIGMCCPAKFTCNSDLIARHTCWQTRVASRWSWTESGAQCTPVITTRPLRKIRAVQPPPPPPLSSFPPSPEVASAPMMPRPRSRMIMAWKRCGAYSVQTPFRANRM